MQAPTGGPPGVRTQGRKGDDGSHTASPPPPCRGTSAAPRACAVLATCLRQRTDSEAPFSPTHPGRGRGQRGDGEATWGGGGRGQTETPGGETGGERWRRQAAGAKKKKQKKNKANQRARAGTDSRDGRDTAGTRERGKGRGKGGHPLGKRAGRQGPTPQRTGGGRGDKSPQETLVRYPASGVWGPPRCPHRPHLSTGNKVGYARDRWPAARGGTGLGGWPMGLTRSTPHGTYCGSCPVRGCG